MNVYSQHINGDNIFFEKNKNGQLILSVGGNSLCLNNKDIDKLIKNLKQMKIYGEIKNEE